jgi:rhodanese-related sulfurtransferase
MGEFDELLMTIQKDKPVVLICYFGLFSRVGAQKLLKNGYSEVYSVAGGMRAWNNEM